MAKHERVALLINNLGGTSPLELGVVCHAAMTYCTDSLQLRVDRVVSGTLMTSIAMAGVSVTILRLGDHAEETLSAFDYEVNAPGWPRTVAEACCVAPELPLASSDGDRVEVYDLNTMNSTSLVTRNVLITVAKKLIMAAPKLSALDAISGDGDCGYTLASGFEVVLVRCGVSEEGQVCRNEPFVFEGYCVLSKIDPFVHPSSSHLG